MRSKFNDSTTYYPPRGQTKQEQKEKMTGEERDNEDENYDILDNEEEKIFKEGDKYSSEDLIAFADKLLREDSNRELCRRCKEKDDSADFLPYGEETGVIESLPQDALDEEGNQLYLDFPELKCEKGHRWFKGEGQRRDIRGPNPILFESHLYNRKRREIYVASGQPDPAFTMDRKGRPTQGIYNRVHPSGRKVNTKSQRAANGAPLALDTPLWTVGGWKTMGTVDVGDYVYEAKGLPVRVVAVSSVFDGRPCYRVTFEDKDSVVADGEHMWNLKEGYRRTEEIFQYGAGVSLLKATSTTLILPDDPSIVYIDSVDSVPVRCITVWNPDHVFLVGRGLHLTCNSFYR